MYKLTIFLVLFTTSFLQISESGTTFGRSNIGSNGMSRSSSYIGKRNSYFLSGGNQMNVNQQHALTEQQNSFNNNGPQNLADHGLSVWSLIFIMIAVIVAGFTIYYSVICYPFLCKNEKIYQFMEVSSTITGATSRSIQSIENFQTDHKH